MAYKFTEVSPQTRQYHDPHNPMLTLTRWALYMPEVIFDNLGRPATIAISVDVKSRAIQLSEEKREGYGWRIHKRGLKDNKESYRVGTVKTPERYAAIYGTLPVGKYRPVDNGIFEYVPATKIPKRITTE